MSTAEQPETEFEAVRALSRAARSVGSVGRWNEAPGCGAILAAGPDIESYLQSQLTSNVQALQPGDAQLSARLTRTGALLSYFVLFRLPDRGQPFPSYLLILPRAEIDSLLADLNRTLVAEQAWLENASDEFEGTIVQGPDALPLIEAARLESGALVLVHSWTGDPGGLILTPGAGDAIHAAVAAAAESAGYAVLADDPISSSAWRWLEGEAGRLRAGDDFVSGKTLLPSTGLDQQTVSTTKGCYLGQEVVARVRTYGTVPRALRALIVHEPRAMKPEQLPNPGSAILTVEGQKIGSWASAGFSMDRDRTFALAYLDRDHRTPKARLTLEAGDFDLEVEIAMLPLHAASSSVERAGALQDQAMRRFHEGADTEAAALLEEAIGLDPTLVDAYEALGVILGRSERYHEAIDVFQRLEELAPQEPMVHTNLSLFYMKIGDKDEAERQKALATMKRFGGEATEEELSLRHESERSMRRQDAERRCEMFREVLSLDPEDGLALMGLGNALLDLEDYAGADEHLARALAVQPDNSALYVSRGKVLEKLNRTQEALDVYRSGLEVAGRKGDFLPLKELEHRLFLLG